MSCKVIASMNVVASSLCVWVFSNRTVKGVVVTCVSTAMYDKLVVWTFGSSKTVCPLTVTVNAGIPYPVLRLNEKDTRSVKGCPLVDSAGLPIVCSINLPPL